MDLRRERHSPSPFQQLTHTIKIALMGTVAICIIAATQLNFSRYFPIKTVKVYGLNRIGQQEMQSLLFPLVNHGFFTINVDYIRERLLQVPWASDIFVRRAWPDKIEITVIEKNAVARWNEQSLLSAGGELFSPERRTYPSHLPLFVGPNGKQIVMLQYFTELNRVLTPLHTKITYLELTPYWTWKLVLDNGITLQIGRKDSLTRLSHFVKVYPQIVKDHAADVDYIDLRYPNGMAVRWKSPV